MKLIALAFSLAFLSGSTARQDVLHAASPESVGMAGATLARIDATIRSSVTNGDIPGAAVEIIHDGAIVYRRSFGARALYPRYEANRIDTIYDLASMTKPIATGTAIMKLIEQGKIRLWDRAAHFDPAFAQHGKAQVTIEELLVHSAGLPSALNQKQSILSEGEGERIVDAMPLHFAPGSQYEYCNTCFIELAKIVRIVSGKSLADFSDEQFFRPLGVAHDMFMHAPDTATASISPEAASGDGTYPRGRFIIGGYGPIGATGHAGLFGTADALAIYAQMLLNRGSYNGKQLLSPLSVETMTAPRYLGRASQRIGNIRGLSWDEATTDSSNRGELFPLGGYGHTGSTGCSLWIDPATNTAVVFLSNAAHSKRDNDDAVVRLYSRIATLAATAIVDKSVLPRVQSQTTAWHAQVAAQAPGFERWAKADAEQWRRTGRGSAY